MMKRIGLGLGLLVLVAGGAFALTIGDLNQVVDLSASLETLSSAASGNQHLPADGRFVLLSGAVASIQIVNRDRDTFSAEFNLVDGHWQGLDSVALYQCIVQVSGPEFFARLPARPPAGAADPSIILPNTEVLVIGVVQGTRALPDGTTLPVVQGVYVRPL